jgi:transcriptional regulator with XRE-family HTH domain
MVCVMQTGSQGSAIRAMRKAQRPKLSLQKLAELSGTSIGYLSEVERGKATPTARWLRDVEEALNEYMLKNRGAA